MTAVARRNLIVFGCGRKGSGKSTLLYRRYTAHFSRVLTLDVTGETREHNPDVIEVAGLPELRRALHWCVRQGSRWHVAAALEDAEFPALFDILAPPLASGRTGFARAVGGMALECGEVDELAPARGGHPDVLAAFKRGRHALLSLLVATQRPTETARVVTSQADYVWAVGALEEAAERAFFARTISPAIADLIAELPAFHAATYCREIREVLLTNDRGAVVRRLDRAGNAI